MHKLTALFLCLLSFFSSMAQKASSLSKKDWVDSVFRTLSEDGKIAQLIVVRTSSIDSKTGKVTFYDDKVADAIRRYNVGGICLFQGGPARQALMVNQLQQISILPLYVSIDAETGLGMRMDSVKPLPRQMMLGAVNDPSIIYEYGRWVGRQCKRAGIHMNYAPCVDVNNNPDNPVINDRSFGENKEKVAEYAILYMKGMQAEGIHTCAKHFPGHGDVAVDSHLDLPVIQKSRSQLDSLELYPFRRMIGAGVDAVMVGHLSIPAIDAREHRASSISYNNVTKLLKQELGFGGMVFTDALEMKGVTKYFPGGEISSEALVAGNDLLCLPEDIRGTIESTKLKIRKKLMTWADIDRSVMKILGAKYDVGLANWKPTDVARIAEDLNRDTYRIRRQVAEQAITLLRYEDKIAFPLKKDRSGRVAYLALGIGSDNAFAKRMRADMNADVYYFNYQRDAGTIPTLVNQLSRNYDAVVIGIHQLKRYPAGKFGISDAALRLVSELQGKVPNSVFIFGNPYAAKYVTGARNIIACYEDDPVNQEVAADMLIGQGVMMGRLPVTVTPELPEGTGIQRSILPVADKVIGMDLTALQAIDSIANDAIRQRATPGIVVLVAKDGKIAYHKGFGYLTYDSTEKTGPENIYDMASVTKIAATTVSVMKLYDQGRLDLDRTLGHYIPWVKGTDKENIVIRDVLLHQARLKSFIPFYRETIDTVTGIPKAGIYASQPSPAYPYRVADSMYMQAAYRDTIFSRIAGSRLEKPGQYIYSDNDFIFLGLIVEAISGMRLEEYVRKEFYEPMGLVTTGFRPRERFPLQRIAPTENETFFRRQLIRGDVHDPGAAMFGGVAGHAGLFSNAYDLAVILQMLLNKGVINGHRFLSDTTVMRFTAYSSDISRRGLGFDKPEKDNTTRKEPYPALSVSPMTFGHTGFTGICAWVDPRYDLIYVFLSNRVNPDGSNKLSKLNVRPAIHEAIYRSLR
jgi:beta-N-acetylhexosaminidase